jgi:hypothetical protein
MAAVTYAVFSLLFGVAAFALLLPQGLPIALLMAPVAGSLTAVAVVALLLVNAERAPREHRGSIPEGVVWA